MVSDVVWRGLSPRDDKTAPWNEMVDQAGDGIDWNALHDGPVGSVGRSAVDQIVGGALRAKTAIFPDNPHRSCAVDGGSGQRATAQARGFSMGLNLSDGHGYRP